MASFSESIGLKNQYESGELIILKGPLIENLSQDSKLILLESSNANRVELESKKDPSGHNFYEFFAVEPGTYQIQSTTQVATFQVVARRGLDFQHEFGIFFVVVAILVLLMAKRYLKPKGDSYGPN